MSSTLIVSALLALRIWGVLRAQAVWRAATGPAWELVAPVLAVSLTPWLASADQASLDAASWTDLALVAVLEFSFGSLIGLAVSLPGWALLGAGGASDAAIRGLGVASKKRPALPVLLAAAAAALGLAAGAHRPLLRALVDLASRFAVASPERWLDFAEPADAIAWLAGLGHELTLLALTLATPVLLTAAVASTSLRLVGAGPREAFASAEALETWIRPAFALAALGAAWAAYPSEWTRALG